MAGHTPGPWTRKPESMHPNTCWHDGASIAEAHYRPDVDEMEANARLIAAAPDMLRALHDTAERLLQLRRTLADKGDWAAVRQLEAAVDAVWAAIAKAEKGA